MYDKSKRPSEIIAQQRQVIEEQEAIIEILKGALAAAGCDDASGFQPWMKGLTGQERAMIGALYASYPRTLDMYGLLERLPGHDRAEERQPQLVVIKVHQIRKKLGVSAIETVRGMGYRLSATLHALIAEQTAPSCLAA